MRAPYPIFVTRWFAHHSLVSGYDQLALRWPNNYATLALHLEGAGGARTAGRSGAAVRFLLDSLARTEGGWILLRQLAQGHRDGKLIHVLYGETDLPLPWVHRLRRVPVVATIHQPVSHLTRSAARLRRLRRQLDGVDLVIALCQEQRRFFEELVGTSRVRVVPHGVDTTFFHPCRVERERSILIVGGWMRDWAYGARVLRATLERCADVSVRLIAPAGDHPLLLSMPAARLQVTPRLSDAGLRQEYQTCGVAFFPFHAATANNALLEASACGCRIVATDVGGVQEYAGRSAKLFEPDAEPADVASALLDEMDQAAKEPICAAAVEQAAGLDWVEVIRQMREVYANLLHL